MSENLKQCMPILLFISKIKDTKLKNSLLKYFAKNPKIYKAIQEISRNIIKGNAKMSNIQRKKLLKNKKILYAIAYDKLDKSQRKKKIVQTGGFSWIFPLIAGIINLI